MECSYCGADMAFVRRVSWPIEDEMLVVLGCYRCPDCHRHAVTERVTIDEEGALTEGARGSHN